MRYVPLLVALMALAAVAVPLASAYAANDELAVPGLRRLRLVIAEDIYALAIVATGAALVGSIFTLRLLDRTPPSGEPARQFLDGVYLLHEPHSSYLFQSRPLDPFLGSLVAAPFNLLGSYDYRFTTACMGSLFLVGTVVTTFLLGRELFGRATGFLAALFMAVYPTTFGLALEYTLDLPLAFMVVLTVLLLVKSREFSSRRLSVLTGVSAGIGAYVSYRFALWVLLPLLAAVAARLVREAREHRLRARAPWLANAGLAAMLALAVALPWYAPRLGFLFGDYLATARASAVPPPSHPPLLSLESLAYYPRALWHVATLPLAISFVALALVFVTRSRSPKLVLAAWIVGGYLTTTLWPTKQTTYLVPILPAVALVTAGGLIEIGRVSARSRVAARGVALALVALTAIQVYGAAVGISWLPRGTLVGELVRPHEPVVWFTQSRADLARIDRDAWDPSILTRKIRSFDYGEQPLAKVLASPAVASALSVPLEKARLLRTGAPRLLVGRGSPQVPTEFVIVEAPTGSTAAARARIQRLTPGFRYTPVLADRNVQPLGTQTLVLFRARPVVRVTPSRSRGGDLLRVRWSSIPTPSARDWIGLYRLGGSTKPYIELTYTSRWTYTGTCTHSIGRRGSNAGTCTLRAPAATGTYEALLFAGNTYKRLATSTKIEVAGVTPRLTASPSVASPPGTLTVRWSHIVRASTLDWVALYRRGAAKQAYVDWVYDSSCTKRAERRRPRSGSCSFAIPDTPGTYEFRLLAANSFSVLATSRPLTVRGGATIAATPSRVAGGATVNVTWRNVTGATPRDWIGLYRRGDANKAFVDWIYDSSCNKSRGETGVSSGSCSFTMPSARGRYEFRLFSNDGYTRVGSTAAVTIR